MAVSRGQVRLISSTAAAYALAAGRLTLSALQALLAAGAIAKMDVGADRSAELSFAGKGADNATGKCRVWAGQWGRNNRSVIEDCELQLFGEVNPITLGTGLAAQAADVSALDLVADVSERLADTLVWAKASTATTPKGIGSIVETVYLSPGSDVYSPADNTQGRLFIPDCGGADFLVVEPVIITATALVVLGNSKS